LTTPSGEKSSPETKKPTATGRCGRAACCGKCNPTNTRLPTKRRGEVAEAAFLHKAARLGFSVAKPWGESDRYDFILDNGARTWRVQVKSAHCDGKNGYSFHACGNVQSRTYTAADIDFFVAYIVPEDVWYVVPIAVFSAIRAVKFFPSSKRRMSRYEKYREAWCLMACPKDGICRQEVDVEQCCQRVTGEGKAPCPKAP
jgi:hypothetical protein